MTLEAKCSGWLSSLVRRQPQVARSTGGGSRIWCDKALRETEGDGTWDDEGEDDGKSRVSGGRKGGAREW